MRKPFQIFIFLFCLPFLGNSQVTLDLMAEGGVIPKKASTILKNAIGSPYINENYQWVKIINFPDKSFEGRFNAYNNEMEIKISANQEPIALDIANNDYEVHFINENKIYKTFDYKLNRGITKRGFLIVVFSEDNVSLLKEEVIKFYDIIPASTSYDQDKPAKFRREDDNYYLKLKSGRIVYLPLKDKEIAKAFPEHSKEIMAFVKKNKLKTKKEEDLIKVANFIGSL